MNIAGIDYGSKLAGTTVIAYLKDGKAQFLQTKKKQDADQFILEKLAVLNIQKVFLDAPLSLPGVYRGLLGYEDFFYRKGDKLLRAMSPMFLGGLTARAMRLHRQLQANNIEVLEIYPAQLAQRLQLSDLNYKKKTENIAGVVAHLATLLPYSFDASIIKNWHQVDALLALYSGWRYEQDEHEVFGAVEEGQIVI